MPKTSKSNFKVEQMAALNEVRSHAIRAHERGYLTNIAIKAQVQATLLSTGLPTHHTASVHNIRTGGFDNYTSDPSMRTLTDDEINTYSYDSSEGMNNMGSAQESATTFNYKSQAEQTYMNYAGN